MIMLFVLLTVLLYPVAAHAIEPVSAFDDAFTVPMAHGVPETVYSFPGAEVLNGDVFAAGGWSVPFGMEELAVSTGVAGFRTGRLGVSLGYTGTGFDLYGDEQEKLGAGYALSRHVAVGGRVTRTAMRIKQFGNADAWSYDAGLIIMPLPGVVIACVREDIADAYLGDSREPLDGRTRIAASWDIDGRAVVIGSASKVRRFDVSYSGGVIVRTGSVLMLGLSGSNEPDRFEFLCGVAFGKSMMSYRGAYHRDLGMTHGFSLSLRQGATELK